MRRCVYITLHNPNCRVRAARLRVPGRCGTKPPQPNTVADAFFFAAVALRAFLCYHGKNGRVRRAPLEAAPEPAPQESRCKGRAFERVGVKTKMVHATETKDRQADAHMGSLRIKRIRF